MGLPFFERAIEYQKQFGHGKSVGNSLQTNGLFIDEAWARFLARYNFLVGLSIDGPARVHDKYRNTADGRGTFERVKQSAARLTAAGVSVNSLTVVNDHSVRFPREIYTTLKDMGISFQQYIPCVEPSPCLSSNSLPYSATPAAYGQFLITLFDLWLDDFKDGRPTVEIRLFDALLSKYVDAPPSECTLLQTCGIYLVVEHNGDVFPCDFFVTEANRLGNLMTTPLPVLFSSPKMRLFGREKQNLPAACEACNRLALCRGGCPKERPVVDGIRHPNYFCESFKALFDHADDRLRAVAARLKETEQRLRRQSVVDAVRAGSLNVGRNAPCPCGSGKKFKKCCSMLGRVP